MSPKDPQTKIQTTRTPDYRESYCNNVQARVTIWDFFLAFGTITPTGLDGVLIQEFQGIFLSPQQAKALSNVLQQNVKQYESAFGDIKLEPKTPGHTIPVPN